MSAGRIWRCSSSPGLVVVLDEVLQAAERAAAVIVVVIGRQRGAAVGRTMARAPRSAARWYEHA
ncbi:hypothetical protein ACFSNO_29210 [Streptomyces cirratus]